MYTVPSYVTYRTEEDAIYITSELYRNTVRLTDHGLQKEFINLTRCGGCAELNTPLTRYLHEQELLVTEEELDHALHQVRSLLDNIFMVTLMPTEGCNFRCPFCQNGNLVQHPEWEPVIPEEEIFAVLEKRRGVLDGVCVTGGEPTLDPDLERFVTKIKELGYLVKLDTNGYRPEILKKLVEEKKIDYVAMDIKNAPSRYGETAGVKKIDVMRINESVEFLKSGVVDYEFRTTLCKELHGREEIEAIGKWLSGAKRYFLQNYRESDYVIDPRFSGYAREQLERFCEILRGKIETVEIRGVD